MKIKITCVYNEGALEDTSFIGAKGLSMLVEMGDEKILFDTGMRGRYLIHNLDFLQVKTDSITKVVLSHNHKANIGGLKKLIENRTKPLDVYTNSSYIGFKDFLWNKVDEELKNKLIIHRMDSDTELMSGVIAMGPFGDLEEFFLLIKTMTGPIVLSSCYHCGTRVVMSSIKERYGTNPCCLIGGIHLIRVRQKDVDPTAEVLKEYGSPELYINHCGTPTGIMYLRVHFGLNSVKDFYVGDSLTLSI